MFQQRPENPARDEETRRLAEMMGISPDELTRRKQAVAAAVKDLQAGSDHRSAGNGNGNGHANGDLQAGSDHRGASNGSAATGNSKATGRNTWRPGEHFRWQQGQRPADH